MKLYFEPFYYSHVQEGAIAMQLPEFQIEKINIHFKVKNTIILH